MSRRLGGVLVVLAALAVAPAASASYPAPYAAQGGKGVMSADRSVRYVAFGAGANTVLSRIRTSDGEALDSKTVAGSFGIPVLTQDGLGGGMFRDGSTFVLQSVDNAAQTTFELIGTSDLAARDAFTLEGTFAFDALSPDGSRLYLIEHRSTQDLQHYVVRAYDLRRHRLLPGRIADKTQRSWVMQGWPAARTSTSDGRWVYTLYANPGGYPFVHALDTVRGVARCVGVGWASADQNALFTFTVHVNGRSLVLRRHDGRAYRIIDRKTWRVSKPR